MKIKINKKHFYIVLFSFIFIILGVFIYFLLRGFPLSWNLYSIDKYEELTKVCNFEKEGSNLIIKCQGFLQSIGFPNQGEKCLSVSLVVNNYSNLEHINVCNNSESVDTNNKRFDTDMLVPIELNLIYKYKIPFSYKLESIKPLILEDKVTFKILDELYKNGIHPSNVRSNELAEIQEKGYYSHESNSEMVGETIGIISFIKSSIKDIHSSNGKISLTMEITVNDIKRELKINTAGFKYYDSHNSDGINITSKNISQIPLNKSLLSTFLYIPYGVEINLEKTKEYCNSDSVQLNDTLCNSFNSLKELQLDKEIDEYVKESLDKLILNSVLPNE